MPFQHDWPRIAPFLGLRPDARLARLISVDPRKVRAMRRRLGIERWHPMKGLDHLLGLQPDNEIARRAGVHPETVRKRRTKLGIARCSMRRVRADRILSGYIDELDKFFNS